MKPFVLLLLLTLFLSCSPQKDAGGTASEGESFVYGYVVDSTIATPALAKNHAANTSGRLVVLSRLSYTATGLVSTWSDSLYAAPDGFFQFKTPAAGVYTLLARDHDTLAAIQASLEIPETGLNLGRIGMHHPIQITGSMEGAPDCQGNLRISMPGIAGFSTVIGNSSFSLSNAPPGHSLILAQCGDTIQQWHIVLSGACSEVMLDSIPWNSKTGTGSGIQGIQGPAWSWRMGPPLVVNERCTLARSGKQL